MVSPVHVSRRSLIQALALAPLAAPAIIGRAHAADPIRIGISGPMTGQFAQNGQWMKNGVAIAVKQVNDKGGIKGRMAAANSGLPSVPRIATASGRRATIPTRR